MLLLLLLQDDDDDDALPGLANQPYLRDKVVPHRNREKLYVTFCDTV
jgi:hypothetical protein